MTSGVKAQAISTPLFVRFGIIDEAVLLSINRVTLLWIESRTFMIVALAHMSEQYARECLQLICCCNFDELMTFWVILDTDSNKVI